MCLQCSLLRMYLPVILAQYISYYEINSKDRSTGSGWGLATGVILLSFVSILIVHHTNLYCQRIGMRSRIATCSLIYRKVTRTTTTTKRYYFCVYSC